MHVNFSGSTRVSEDWIVYPTVSEGRRCDSRCSANLWNVKAPHTESIERDKRLKDGFLHHYNVCCPPSDITPFCFSASFSSSAVMQPRACTMPDLDSAIYEDAPRDCFSADQIWHKEHYLRARSFRNARTRGQFKPRNVNKGTSSYQLRQFAEATLGSGSLRKAVKLPDGEDLNEWLAVNGLCYARSQLFEANKASSVVDFYNQINLLYGSITEFCSPHSCPEMKATDEYVEYTQGILHSRMLTPARFEYLWQDSENFKRPTKMPAPQYVEHLMGWVQSNIDNEQMFPSRIGKVSHQFDTSTC